MKAQYRRDIKGWFVSVKDQEAGPFDYRTQAKSFLRNRGTCPMCGERGEHVACEAADAKEEISFVVMHVHPTPTDPPCPDCEFGKCRVAEMSRKN